jgi:hypothetical protein
VSEETLFTAARRAIRMFNIDQHHGGLVSVETLAAMQTLEIQVEREKLRAEADRIEKADGQSL